MKGLSITFDRIAPHANIIVAVSLMAVYLFPIAQPIYFSDDAFLYLNGLIDQKIMGSNAWWFRANEEIEIWAKTNGRFSPLSAYLYFFLIYSLPPIIVKWIYFLSTCLTIVVAGFFVKRLIKGLPFALFILIALSCIQFCIRYHDAYNSFGLLYHSIITLNLLSLIFLDKYLESQDLKVYIFSILLFALGILSQEIAIIFLPIYFLFIVRKGRSGVVFLPYFTIGAFFIICIASLKFNLDTNYQYEGVKAEFNIFKNLYVLYAQSLGSLPIRNSFCFYFDINVYQRLICSYWIELVLLLSFAFFILKSYLNIPTLKISKYTLVIVFILILMPALAISFSSKYIKEVSECRFYIPVFIQIFGVAILLTSLFIRFIRLRVFLMIIMPFVLALSYLTNRLEIENGIKKHYRHTHLMDQLKEVAKNSQSGDTVFTFNMWTEEKVLNQLTELYLNKKIVYKNISMIDTAIVYPKILVYSMADNPRFLFFKDYKIKIRDFE
jgi:hypothetical protein